MVCGDSQDISIVEETRATEAQLRKGNLSDMMQEENTKIGVAADDALEAPPMAPAVRSIVHKVFRITYWLRKSILSFFLSLIIYCHKLHAPVLNYQPINHRPKTNRYQQMRKVRRRLRCLSPSTTILFLGTKGTRTRQMTTKAYSMTRLKVPEISMILIIM